MTVKLQKQLAYKYKGKEHFKHVLVIPEDTINKLGWKVGQDLELDTIDNHLVIKSKTEDSEKK